jgi:hypothetical protein
MLVLTPAALDLFNQEPRPKTTRCSRTLFQPEIDILLA